MHEQHARDLFVQVQLSFAYPATNAVYSYSSAAGGNRLAYMHDYPILIFTGVKFTVGL